MVIKKFNLLKIEVIKIFEYKKNSNRYYSKAKLYKKIINKVLLIAKIFYFKNVLLFLFDNIISYLNYIKNLF